MAEKEVKYHDINDVDDSDIRELTEAQKIQKLSLVTPERLEKLEYIRSLDWTQRMFRKFETGSMRGVIMMWVRMTMGIGILTLPYYFKQYGIVVAFMVLIISAALNLVAYHIIFDASCTTEKKTYPELIETLLGNRILGIFKVVYVTDIGSAILAYLIISWNLLEYMIFFFKIGTEHWAEWIENMDNLTFNEYNPTILKLRGVFIYGVFILTIPLFLKRDLGSLQNITVGYLIALSLLLLIIIIEVPFFRHAYEDEAIGLDWFKMPKLGWIECFFGVCISYYAQPFVFSLRNELLLPSLKRTKKVSTISVALEAIVFMVIGFLGYFALGNIYTPTLFILRKPYPGKNPISEFIFQFAIVLFFVLNTLGIAMFNPSLREYLEDIVKMKNEKVKYIVLSLLPFFMICTLAFVYPSIIEQVNFFGYTVNNFIGYIIPFMMQIKLLQMRKAEKHKIVLCVVMIAVLALLGCTALFLRIFGFSNLE